MAKNTSRNSGWGLFLLFWTMLLLMLGFLACVVFYKYAAVYEETRAERTMDMLMEQMSEEDWREALAAPPEKSANTRTRAPSSTAISTAMARPLPVCASIRKPA